MSARLRNILISLMYCLLLSWLYLTEITEYWQYMGFVGQYSLRGLVLSVALTAIIAAILPDKVDVRGLMIGVMNYMFFIPAIVYLSYSDFVVQHYYALIGAIVTMIYCSSIKLRPLALKQLSERAILFIVFGAIIAALSIQAGFGGLTRFNLDIERVYEFRADAAFDLPPIFGYVYSNVASVLVPLALVLSLRAKRYELAGLALLGSIILFGMSHHKSVLFAPLAVAGLYFAFLHSRRTATIGLVMLAIPILGVFELIYLRTTLGDGEAAYLNSLVTRRVLFFPAMLDNAYVEYFSNNAKFYWSTSRIAFWGSENPYGVTAPFVIGQEYFFDQETSANTGVIGSGFANAGLIGIAIYAAVTGLLVALLNTYGRYIGHSLVAAASFATIYNIVTSTDLLTAFLTHGLLLLVLLLAVFPRDGSHDTADPDWARRHDPRIIPNRVAYR